MRFKTHPRTGRGFLVLSAVAVLATVFFVAQALAATTITAGAATTTLNITPTLADTPSGNVPDCPDGTNGLKFPVGHVFESRKDNGTGVTVTLTPTTGSTGGTFFDFSVDMGSISTIYVKTKGQDSKITTYTYPLRATTDTALHGPVEDGVYKQIEHVTVCTSASAVAAVTLRSVTAKRSAKGVTVNWRTASEIDVAGYNVYGLVHGKRVKLNAHIIASKGAGANSYAYQYRTIKGQKAPSRFWLQSINLDGSRQWHAARAAR